MRNQVLSVFILFTLLFLTACPKKIRISERVILNSGNTNNLLKNGFREIGPGDTIKISRWRPSKQDAKNNSNQYGPIGSNTYRIPLRLVNEQTGLLYSYEREFLLDILNTNRSEIFNLPSGDKPAIETGIDCAKRPLAQNNALKCFARELVNKERQLWNYLVTHMYVRCVENQGQSENQPKCRGNNDYLMIKVSFTDLGKILDAEYLKFLRFNPQNPNGSDYEIMGIDQSYISPQDAILGNYSEQGNLEKNEEYYGSNNNAAAISTFNFIDVIFRDVNISEPSFPENQWSLRDLEESKICEIANIRSLSPNEEVLIKEITLRESGITLKISRNTDKIKPTYQVSILDENDKKVPKCTYPTDEKLTSEQKNAEYLNCLNAKNEFPKREILRATGFKKLCINDCYVISKDDLENLRIEDVKSIKWGIVQDKTKYLKGNVQLKSNFNCQGNF